MSILNTIINYLKKWIASVIPGILIGALVLGPSKITIASKLGAEFGYSLLWVVIVAIFFMLVFTSVCTRIAIATNKTLLISIRQKMGTGTAVIIGCSIFLVTVSFQTGNSIAIGIATGELTHTSPKVWIIVFNAVSLVLLIFRTFYKILEKTMLLLILFMLGAFLTTLILVNPNYTEVVGGLVPVGPGNAMELVVALVASCFSIVGAFYQSYLTLERKKISAVTIKYNTGALGIMLLGVMVVIVMICAATVLKPYHIVINTATDMAQALRPLLGNYASTFFLCGLFGASFSALVGNATIGGTILADALNLGSMLQSRAVRGLIALVMLAGAGIALILGKLPLSLIVFTQSITILIVPFIALFIILIANDSTVMGKFKNRATDNILAVGGLLLLLGLAIYTVNEFVK